MAQSTQLGELGSIVRRNSNGIKAILLILVVLDHNDWIRDIYPDIFKPLTFHVLGFFFLAFSFSPKFITLEFIRDRACRYLVPYAWALTVGSIGYFVLFSPHAANSRLAEFILALFLGSAPFVKAASGLLMLWFLPCLFGLSCLIATFDSIRSKHFRYAACLIAVIAHLAIPLVPAWQAMWAPVGLAVAANVFVLGLVWRQLLLLRPSVGWEALSLIALIASYGVLARLSLNIEIGTLQVYGIDHPGLMLIQDVAGISGVMVVVLVANRLGQIPWIDAIGQRSLLVYLIHPFVYQLCHEVASALNIGGKTPMVRLMFGFLSASFALWLALVTSMWIMNSARLSAWVIPRTFRSWPLSRLFS